MAIAAPLGLQLQPAPDIYSGFIDVVYNATTDTLIANGFALTLDDDNVGPPHAITNGAFVLSAPIDGTGILGAGGTISITGKIPSLGMNSGTLLTGTLTEFGFKPSGGDPLELRFDVTGGDVAIAYGSTTGGIILAATGFPGSFAANFDNLDDSETGTGAGAADTAPSVEPPCRGDGSTKGSLLFFSKVELKWSGDGKQLLQDTFLTFTNDYSDDVAVQAFLIAGDRPIEQLCADPQCRDIVREFEPGWNTADCRFTLTGDQPQVWSASRGGANCPAFTVLDPRGPGRLDPETGGSTRILRGYVVAWAVKFDRFAPDTDNRGLYENIRWNHLEGSGLIVNYANPSAWEYNAWSFQVCNARIAHGEKVGEPGELLLDGYHYNTPFASLLFDFYGSNTVALSGPGTIVAVDTDLTLHPADLDLRQDGCGPVLTKVEASIWNEFETKFSGTRRCVCCWDQTMIGRWSQSVAVPNHFLRTTLRTDRGKARLNGVESTECDYRTHCGIEPRTGGVCMRKAGPGGSSFSRDAALLGLATKFLTFSGPGVFKTETSGVNLTGMGDEPASILVDILYGPYETLDAPPDARAESSGSAPAPKIEPSKMRRSENTRGNSDRSGQ